VIAKETDWDEANENNRKVYSDMNTYQSR